MKKSDYALLIVIFMLTLGARLCFSFSVPGYSSDEAYFNIRQINHIQQTSKPLYEDELSFSGRRIVFPPLFGYVLAFLGLVFPLEFTAKFFPNLSASMLVFFTYLIARKISKSSTIALLTSFISGFMPAFFQQTFNSISVYSVVIPLFFLLLYSFMNLRRKKWIYCYIITLVTLTLIHPSVILFIAGILFYLLLVKLEGLKQDKAEMEVVIFSTFFVILSQLIMFKKIFLFHGPFVIWQNIPKELLSGYFAQVSITQAIYYIGVVPALCGAYIVYRYTLKEKNKNIYLLISFVFSFALLLWLRLLEIKVGLMFLGVITVLLFAQFFKLFLAHVKSTRAARYTWLSKAAVFIVLVFTLVIPTFSLASMTIETSVTEEEIAALNWINENTSDEAVILGTVHEGNLITAIAERRNVIDSNFLFIKDAEQRYSDVSRIYTTFSITEAIDLLDKYNISYIYFSPKARTAYGIEKLSYSEDKCFSTVYDSKVVIYKVVCSMRRIR